MRSSKGTLRNIHNLSKRYTRQAPDRPSLLYALTNVFHKSFAKINQNMSFTKGLFYADCMFDYGCLNWLISVPIVFVVYYNLDSSADEPRHIWSSAV